MGDLRDTDTCLRPGATTQLVDAAIMPTIPRANPHRTFVIIGERMMAHIREEASVGQEIGAPVER